MPLNLYNTRTKRIEAFVPGNPEHVTFYSCGPTVYDDAHIGNFRSFLAADVLRRFVESPLCELSDGKGGVHKGPRKVTHVMNITDVGHMTDDADGGENGEDRMSVAGRRLEEAKKSGKLPAGATIDPKDPYQIARFYEDRFKEDARKLGLKLAIEAEKDATLMPRATENIEGMIAVISRLISRGNAYVTGAPGSRVVYFDVRSFEPYGQLSGNTLERLKEGEGGRVNADNQATKKHPADFLLWKEDASHVMKWESPWGKGYPGWHIECTAMSVSRLLSVRGPAASPAASPGVAGVIKDLASLADIANGKPLIDLHSGGEDNIFPHHECEIAQSCCAFNAEPTAGSFAAMWFHPRFLLVEGTKMSKSKGNFFTARDLFAKGIEPAALRLELIKTHYRSNANFTMQGLVDSQRQVERWARGIDEIKKRFAAWATKVDVNPLYQSAKSAELAFASAMHEDLNIAKAIAVFNETLPPLIDMLPPAPEGFEWNEGLKSVVPMETTPFAMVDRVLGVLGERTPQIATMASVDYQVFGPVDPDHAPVIQKLLNQRRDARAAKDFKASDAIRDQLAAMGYAIKDAKDGKVEVSRK
jgi:cysteinyl-tRNA synthetase